MDTELSEIKSALDKLEGLMADRMSLQWEYEVSRQKLDQEILNARGALRTYIVMANKKAKAS